MSLISRTAQYALRAMTLLATQDERLTVKQLAEMVGAPQPYLARIIMQLAEEGIVDARRGPGGGLRLGRPTDQISLMEIVTCFDGNTLFSNCALGLPGCGESNHQCPVHKDWGVIREKIRSWWNNTTLADFSPARTTECLLERVQGRPDMFPKVSRVRGRWH